MSSHPPSSIRSLSLTGASRWSVVLRIFMILAAWHGPMPWCHCHGTLSDADQSHAPSWLAGHLQSYHASISPLADVFLGWHMHAVFPGRSSDDPDQPAQAEQFRLPASGAETCLADHLAGSGDGLSISLAEQIELHAGRFAGEGESAWRATAHFFDHFAPTLPLPLRFCVARC